MLVAMQTFDASCFYKVVPVGLSLVPLAPISAWLLGCPSERRGPASAGGHAWRSAALFAGAGLMLGTMLFFIDPGQMKDTRLLIDEAHGPWESTLVPMEDKTLDALSSYNYYWLGRWLRGYYKVATHEKGPLTDAALGAADILMVKTPTQAYSADEIAGIRRFVENGGGLWLIGDHTDVFGTTTYGNPLASGFGLRFVPDATYDLGFAAPLCVPPPYPVHPVARQIMASTWCTRPARWKHRRARPAWLAGPGRR